MLDQLIPDLHSLLSTSNLLIWLGIWSLVGFGMMAYDKLQAVLESDRISEKTLHEVALAGGFVGIIIGARVFNHKTAKSSFWGAVAVAVLVWMVVAYIVAFEIPSPNAR